VSRALVDTSVFIAAEQGRSLEQELPDEIAVSVITLAELEVGVLVAEDDGDRASRLSTLLAVRETADGLPADAPVASAYARLAAASLRAGRRPRVHDTLIAATAAVHDAAVWTRDEDFSHFEGVEVVRI